MSTAANVYSFGVVLLEIFIRKRPTDDMFKDGLNIVSIDGHSGHPARPWHGPALARSLPGRA